MTTWLTVLTALSLFWALPADVRARWGMMPPDVREAALDTVRPPSVSVAPYPPGPFRMAALPTGSREISGWLFRDPRNAHHIGLDYACEIGDPIVAAQSGTVLYVGEDEAYGKHVLISHGGTRTLYAHLSQALAYGRVAAGQIIGVCGSTGASTSAHLHLEVQVYRDGQWVCVDPAGVEP